LARIVNGLPRRRTAHPTSHRSTDQICDHSASFFKLNHFFSFGFSVLSGCGGVLGGLWFASQLSRVELRDQVAERADLAGVLNYEF
jgi:hypothetical protein